MKKLRKHIEQFLNTPWQRICFYLLLAFMAGWFRNLENQDELWNYAFASNIANGLLPYRDFNILQTPFSCLVNSIAILIFGHHLLVIRMMGVLLFTGIAAMADKVSRQLGAKGIYQMFVPAVFLCMFFWNVFLEYSCLILFFELCLISFDLDWIRGKKKSVLQQICAGVLMGCAMMCKQTFGTFLAVASWVSVVCVCRMRRVSAKREEQGLTEEVCPYNGSAGTLLLSEEAAVHTRKLTAGETVLALFYRMLGTSIPCFAFLFYLLGTGTFEEFWDMAFNGIRTFTSSYSYWAFMKENPAYFFLGALLPLLGILTIIIMVRYRGTHRARFSLIVMIYSAFGCVNMIPMANSYHVMTCSIPILLLLFTVLPQKLLNFKKQTSVGQVTDDHADAALPKRWRFFQVSLRIVAGIAVVGVSVFILLINPIDDAIHYDLVTDVRGLECTFMNEKQHEEITAVDAYVREQNEKGITVYMLDNFAPLYFLPSNQYHKYFDMFLVGNLGTKTPEECLLEADETAVFLIPDSSRGQFQYPWAEITAFLEGLKRTGEIGEFAIYEY